MAPVKVGIVGCGRIAQLVHLPMLARFPGVEVVAGAESDAQRLEQPWRRVPAAARFPDHASLLARSDAEAVVICLPPALHAEAAIAAFEAGRCVYLEKPIATNPTDAEAVVRAWRRAGRVGMIGFNFRFNPARSGAGWPPARSVRWSRPARPSARRAVNCPHGSGRAPGVNANRFEIFGSEGVLAVGAPDDLPNPVKRAEGRHARLIRLRRALAALHPKRVLRSPGQEFSFARALQAFVESARAGRPVQPDMEDGLHCLMVVAAAERAIALGRMEVVQPSEPVADERRGPRAAEVGGAPVL